MREIKTLLFSLLILVLGLAVVSWLPLELTKEEMSDPDTSSFGELDPRFSDDDYDGLAAWEEALWETDPTNPDSDGDGVDDGIEVRVGRNPRDASSEDTLFAQNHTQVLRASEAPRSTETQDKDQDPETTSTTIASTETLRTYGNHIGKIIRERTNGNQDDVEIFTRIINEPSLEAFAQLSRLSEKYYGLSEALLEAPVPGGLQSLHYALSASYQKEARAIEAMRTHGTEHQEIPVALFEAHNTTVIHAGNALLALAFYFKNEGVSFEPNEPGSIFTLLPS